MSRTTISVQGLEFAFENGRVQIQCGGKTQATAVLEVANLLLLVAGYFELKERRTGGRLVGHISCQSNELCRWVQIIISRYRRDHEALPLPYQLFFLPGEPLTRGRLIVQKANTDTVPPSLRFTDQLAFRRDDDGPLDLDEEDLSQVLHAAAIELLGPIWEGIRRSAVPTQRAQSNPGYRSLAMLVFSGGFRLFLTWLVFRPWVWLRSWWQRSDLERSATRFRELTLGAFADVSQNAATLSGQLLELREQAARAMREASTAQGELARETREFAAERARAEQRIAEAQREGLRLAQASREAVEAAGTKVARLEQQLQAERERTTALIQSRAALMEERNQLAHALGMEPRND